MVIDLQAELLGDRLEALVVVAALAAGVADLTVVRDRVRRFVQQRRQDGSRTAGETFAADEDLGELGRCRSASGLPRNDRAAGLAAGRLSRRRSRRPRLARRDVERGSLPSSSQARRQHAAVLAVLTIRSLPSSGAEVRGFGMWSTIFSL